MLFILGIPFLVCGGIMTFKTEAYYRFEQKSRTNDVTTPTPSWVFRTRVVGVILILLGVAFAIAQFLV